jgi:cobalt/nickel transport system permease protein
MERMRMARRARGFKGGRSLLDRRALGTISATIGMVFVRSNQRATNIYDALLTRGYSGQIRTMGKLKVRPRDAALAMAFVSVGSLAVLIQTEVIPWTPCF